PTRRTGVEFPAGLLQRQFPAGDRRGAAVAAARAGERASRIRDRAGGAGLARLRLGIALRITLIAAGQPTPGAAPATAVRPFGSVRPDPIQRQAQIAVSVGV